MKFIQGYGARSISSENRVEELNIHSYIQRLPIIGLR
jgi:hypothetical protein